MTISIDLIRALTEHAAWANNRLLDVAETVDSEELHRPIHGTDDTIFTTLVHMLDGQEFWLTCLQERDPVPDLEPSQFANLDSIRTRWREADGAMEGYLLTRTATNLEEPAHYRFLDGREGSGLPWQILLHQALHQQQHRSEIAAALTATAHSPGDLDILYIWE